MSKTKKKSKKLKARKVCSKAAKDKENAEIRRELIQFNEQAELDKNRQEADVKEALQINESTLMDEFETSLSSNEPIRELFTPKNIKFKTQLTEEQRAAVAILYHAYSVMKARGIVLDSLKFVLDEYIDFGVSIDRKGREEYVDAHKAYMQHQNQNPQMNSNIDNMNTMKM